MFKFDNDPVLGIDKYDNWRPMWGIWAKNNQVGILLNQDSYQNLVERVEGCQLNNITSTVAMELYLGSIIEPIRKPIRNALYFNSKHAPKTLGEAMQKAQDLHIKHLYASGEDQQDASMINSQEVLPEITVNEASTRENRGWYRNNREFSEHSQNLQETPRQMSNYI